MNTAINPPSAWLSAGMVLGAGILFALPYLYADWYALSWIAFVPLLFSSRQLPMFQVYGGGFLFGLGCYITATFWSVDFLMLFKQFASTPAVLWSLLFWIYSAQLPALMLLVYEWLRRNSGVSECLLFPVVAVAFYGSFPMLFSAQIGESQSHFLIALQGVELTGVHGLDAIVALSNVLLLRLVLMKKNVWRSAANWVGATVVALWFGYGMLVLPIWQQKIESWPRMPIGLVQPNEPPHLGAKEIYPGYSQAYPPEMEMTRRLALAGAELVIWPESAYKGYFDNHLLTDAYQHEVSNIGVSLLLQDIKKQRTGGSVSMLNTVTLLDENGQSQGEYQKIKRVAFGEYVPFVSEVPVLRRWVEAFFGEFLNEIEQGQQQVAFRLQPPDQTPVTIIPLICYETMFPVFVADAVSQNAEAGLLVAVSSNAWFGASRQPYQHITSAVLRAVENRMPMVHVVNNGPSTVTTPYGRVMLQTSFRQAGGYLAQVPVYKEGNSEPPGHSFYSRYPRWFLTCIYVVLAGVAFRALIRR